MQASLLAFLVLLLTVLAGPAPADAAEPPGAWPVPDHTVVHPFEPPEERWLAGHRGVDLAGSVGTPVVSALAGRVSFAGVIAGVQVVVVDHGSTRTTYQPVVASVRIGEEVDRGDRLGRLAWFGTHCLPAACLHWGWRRGETYLDPLDLVGGGPQPIRLYPQATPLARGAAVSGTWMGLLVGLAQPVGGDMGVDLRRGQ